MNRAKAKVTQAVGTVLQGLVPALDKFFSKPGPSYLLLAAVQMKIIWGAWRYRDLTIGDTSYYFNPASDWAKSLHTDIVWSPLYTAFYGTAYALLKNAYDATILHRELIVLAASVGVLAVARRMLPPALALLVALWWAVLPINFDTLYEVHLFAVLPILCAWLFAMRADSSWSRGAALATLVLTTVLMRNELSFACLLYSIYCLRREAMIVRSAPQPQSREIGVVLLRYIAPMVMTVAIAAFIYWRTPDSHEVMLGKLHGKHTLNMCQVFAFGYAQRHPEWTQDPWTQCYDLMTQTFGDRLPTLGQMASHNFPALMQHFIWNLSLAVNGFQVALFNGTSGLVNPDYPPVHQGRYYAFLLSVALVAVVVSAIVVASANWRSVWSEQFRRISYRWAILIAVAAVAVPVILTQRPRPSYLFASTIFAMIVVGSSVRVLTYRWPRVVETAALAVAVGMLTLLPSFYVTHPSSRPLRTAYERLLPYRAILASQPGAIVLGDYSGDLARYLELTVPSTKVMDYGALAGWDGSGNLCSILEEKGVSAILVRQPLLGQWYALPAGAACLRDPEAYGWQRIGTPVENEAAVLLVRRSRPRLDGHRLGVTPL